MSNGALWAIVLTVVIHFAAMVLLLAHLGGGVLSIFRIDDGGDDGRGGPRDEPDAPEPRGGDPLPLPDAGQAPVRLREPGRIAERYTRPERRPAHVPERAPERTPSG
jgi:hypothetical protein